MTDIETAGRTSSPTGSKEAAWIEPRSGNEAELLELAGELRKAELHGDVAFLERILASDFVGIGPRGFVLDKTAWLGRHRSGDLKYESLDQSEVRLRTYGDTAIFTAIELGNTTYKGQPVSVGALRAAYAFVRHRGSWHLAHVQYSPILGAP